MGTSDDYAGSVNATSRSEVGFKTYIITGWVLTVAGAALWTLGYFTVGSSSLLDWTAFSPQWISDYLPNWQSEVGMLIAVLGQAPILCGQSKASVAA